MDIINKNTDELIPYVNNARTHSPEQVTQIAASIKEFGFCNPVLIDKDSGIIAGHGRVMAAQKLGMETVPTIELSHLSDTQRKAYILADNRLAEKSGWDDELLRLELGELQDLDFDLSLIGFDDFDLTIDEIPAALTDEDEVPEVPEVPVTKLGDVWLLGNHRLMCGDSTSIDAVDKLMNGVKADMVFTDPPYGISIVSNGGKVGGGGAFGGKKNEKQVPDGGSNRVECNVYAKVAGDNSIDTAIDAIQIIATLDAKVEIIWGGNYYSSFLPNSSCWIVWDKQNTGNFADCELAWTNQKTAVRKFQHMWNGMVKASEHGEKRVHPTQKPVALADWCIEQYGKECNTVLDLFGGSGFTLISCENKNKAAFIMEFSESYVDVIVNRWQNYTGKQATLESTGETFGTIKEN